jgi:hypothetical protein
MTIDEDKQAKIKSLMARIKEQNQIRNKVTGLLRESPKTVPEIAAATGIPTNIVFWHIIAMRKYGEAAEAELKGNYPSYRLIEGK